MAIKARIASNGNIKLGRTMGTFSKLYGNADYSSKYGTVCGTCGDYCKGCFKSCYVGKSYRYPTVVDGHARNTIAFREDLGGAFETINKQLDRKRKPFDTVRINQSGEIESTVELLMWIATAARHPETRFYLYTKNFDALKAVINSAVIVPDNFTVNISIWHEYGIEEFKAWQEIPWIKTFVYDDGFDYKAYGIEIQTYCKAYDKNGKMDHAITCDKCRKCFNSKFKIIGCYDH